MTSKLLPCLKLEYYGNGAVIMYALANITIEEYYFPYIL